MPPGHDFSVRGTLNLFTATKSIQCNLPTGLLRYARNDELGHPFSLVSQRVCFSSSELSSAPISRMNALR